MALFTRRDRIAIAVIGLLIFAGWGIRFGMRTGNKPADLRVIRNAVEPPAVLNASDTLRVSGGLIEQGININTAGADELERLPLIGPSRAAAIVAYRTEHGPFRNTENIMQVTGIGPGIYEGIKQYITVSDSSRGLQEQKK